MKGSSFQKLYIADPHDEPTADSLTEEAVSVVDVGPFWNTVRSCQDETNLKFELITSHVGWTVTAKDDGFKGMKHPVKIEMHVPILSNGNVIEAGLAQKMGFD